METETETKTLDLSNPVEAEIKFIFGDIFGLPVRLLDAKTQAIGKAHFAKAMDMTSLISYNDFDGEAVARVLWDLHNQGVLMSIEFGRQGSPVLFIKAPYWKHQSTNYTPLWVRAWWD